MPPNTKYFQRYAWFLAGLSYILLFLPHEWQQPFGLVIAILILPMIPFLFFWQKEMNVIMRKANIETEAKIAKYREERHKELDP